MPPRHESFFEYGLARPYPFRWFTWTAVIGCMCACVLFTFLNIGTNGYDLKPVYTTNPNGTSGTAGHELWFQKPPFSWLSSLEASCQSQPLMLESNYITTHAAFSYTLISLSRQDETDKIVPLLATPYLNNTLQNCTVDSDSIYIFPARKDTSLKSAFYWSWSETYAEAKVSCLIPGPVSLVTASFLVQYRRTPGVIRDFRSLDNRTDSSQWWGYQALSRTWGSLATHMGSETVPESDDHPELRIDGGDFRLSHNSSSASDLSSQDFFYITGKFFAEDSSILMVVNENSWDPIRLSQMNNTGLASALDSFAKAFYSSILLDLGSPSPLTDSGSIKYLLSQRGDPDIPILGVNATEAFDTFKDDMAPLNSTPAQLSLQYMCSVPQQKDRLSMVVSVIIADIVLLSAFWTCLNWAAMKYVSSRNPHWNHWPGCERNAEHWKIETSPKMDEESVQLVPPEKMV